MHNHKSAKMLIANYPSHDKLANSIFSFLGRLPAVDLLTAIAIAIAITQSSCAPDDALEPPSGCRTNVRSSLSNRGL